MTDRLIAVAITLLVSLVNITGQQPIGPIDLSAGMRAYQSSLVEDPNGRQSTPSNPDLAVDRSPATCTTTRPEPEPWWGIDMGDLYDIVHVELYRGPPTVPTGADVQRPLVVLVGNKTYSPGVKNDFRECRNFTNYTPRGFFKCSTKVTGTDLVILLPATANSMKLRLCSLRLLGRIACDKGTYGPNCKQSCNGNCNNHTCHGLTGVCRYGCVNDGSGPTCSEGVSMSSRLLGTLLVAAVVLKGLFDLSYQDL